MIASWKAIFFFFQGLKDAGLTGFGSFIANRLLHSVERNTMCISLVSFCFGGRSRLSTFVAQFLRRDQTEVTEESVGLFIIIFLSRQMCRNIHPSFVFVLHPRLIIFSFFLRRRRRRCKDSSSFPLYSVLDRPVLALWSVVFFLNFSLSFLLYLSTGFGALLGGG